MKKNWLAFNINMPVELIPLYDFLQEELNFILSDPLCRKMIQNIDYNQHKGNVWRDLRDVLRFRIEKWGIKNKTWYSYILFENIRREIQSKRENVLIFEELMNNENRVNEELFNKLIAKHKIYATRGRVLNLKRSQKEPVLPNSSTFQLDYTVSAAQNFKKDEENLCRIQCENGEWIEYQIYLPTSLNGNLTGRIAKPRFFKRERDGRYIGLCSYEYEPRESLGESILGVDIGQLKKFSAVALHKSGRYSREYVQSKLVSRLDIKLKRLYKEKELLHKKFNNFCHFKIETDKNKKRI